MAYQWQFTDLVRKFLSTVPSSKIELWMNGHIILLFEIVLQIFIVMCRSTPSINLDRAMAVASI